MKKIVVSSMFGAFLVAAAATAPEAAAETRIALNFGTSVPIACSNPGSTQDVAKTPMLKNTTTATLPKNALVYWSASDGDKSSIRLEADLAPGASVKVTGAAGQVYTCNAHFFSSPDLIVKSAKFADSANVAVSVENLDPWAGPGPSVVRVEVVACSSGAVLQTSDSAPISLAKGETKAITIPATFKTKTYLRVTADAAKSLLEKKETNNVWDTSGSCLY
jgi:hypothetical protein